MAKKSLQTVDKLDHNEINHRKAEIRDAIRIALRSGIKAPRMLVRYQICLVHLQEWLSKKRLAATKYDRYRREAERIAKRLNK